MEVTTLMLAVGISTLTGVLRYDLPQGSKK